MANPNDFLLNTDYEMDKIVYFKSGSVMPTGTPSSHTKFYVDNFDLGCVPLIFGVFSFSEDFNDTRMSWTFTDDLLINIEAVSDGILMDYANTNTNQRLYYRLYGFEPSNSTAQIGSTQKDAKQFIINTDYNYCKLYKKGVLTANGSVKHNLGYTPLVLAWQEYKWQNPAPSLISPCWMSGGEDTNIASVTVTPTEISVVGIPANGKLHYRIYYDEV